MKALFITCCFVLLVAFLWRCNKEEDISEACKTQPMQVFLEYRADTLFAIVPPNQSSGVSYIWQSGERDRYIVPKAPGNYTVTATDSRGCSAANSMKLGCSNTEFKVQDFEGNAYRVIEVGGQCWCIENLRTRSLATGIPLRTTTDWVQSAAYAKFEFGNDTTRTGLLYNRIAAQSGVCPTGWRVAQAADWTSLFNNLGGQEVAALKLRNVNGWNSEVGNNASGFGAMPTGRASQNGSAITDIQDAFYWSQSGSMAYHIVGDASREVLTLEVNSSQQDHGFAIRCMKDAGENALLPNDSTPLVVTLSSSVLGYYSARVEGQLVNANGSQVTEYGFRWKESNSNEEFSRTTTNVIGTDGSFSVELDGLKHSTQYTFKAFAKNANGFGEGQPLDFTTNALNLDALSVNEFKVNATAPDRFEVTFNITSSDPDILVEKVGLLAGKGFEPNLNNFTQKKIEQGTDFSSVSFNQIIPKKIYTLQPFVIIQGVEEQPPSWVSFDFITVSVHWSDASGENWNKAILDGVTYPAVLLNNDLVWMSKNLETTSLLEEVTNLANFSPQEASFLNTGTGLSSNILYNAYALGGTNSICPDGWRVPTSSEAQTLLDWLMDIYEQVPEVLQSMRSSNWANGNNESGLNATESGFIPFGGGNSPSEWNTHLRDDAAFWWTANSSGSQPSPERQYWFGIEGNQLATPNDTDKRSGGSIRCVRNR